MSTSIIKTYLSPDDCRAIVRALELASEQYRRDANTDDNERIARTFRDMELQAKRLMVALEEEPLAVLA